MMNRREDNWKGCKLLLAAVLAAAGIGSDRALAPASGQAEPEPLKGVLHLRVDDVADSRRRNLRLDEAGVLPLKAGDRIRIEARLNRPAYLYLFWIGSDGKVGPIYPWTEGKWERRPAQEQKVKRVILPATTDQAWTMPAGSAGIETLVLLAREHSVLAQRDAEKLAKLVSTSPVLTSSLIKEAVRLENGREITLDLHDRSAPSTKPRKSNDPALRIRRLLSDQVQPLGDYCHALIFPCAAGK
jgi:hypothetical protein